jgi:glucose-1-phosphate adenylyltransferase
VIGDDPEADAQRFYRTDKGVVLITKDMLDRLPPA